MQLLAGSPLFLHQGNQLAAAITNLLACIACIKLLPANGDKLGPYFVLQFHPFTGVNSQPSQSSPPLPSIK